MARKSRIKADPPYPRSKIIQPTQVPSERKLSFSLEHLDGGHRKFGYSGQNKKYFMKLLERLKNVCCMTRKDFVLTQSKALRTHQIKWEDTAVSEDSFGLGEDISDDAWQFSISSNKHGRVHGFFVEEVFFVRWLDPNHSLYPGNVKKN